MNCPKCGHNKTFVIDSRMDEKENKRRRRHECKKCGHRFCTKEEVSKYWF